MTFSRAQKVVAVVIILVAVALRFYGITRWSLNNDEIAEVRWSSGTLSELFDELRRDTVHPPLDYLVQYAIGKSGAPEWVRRIPPVLCGVATVGCLILLGAWWHSPRAGLAAGLFLAFSPMYVRYSQEVRPYSLGIFLLAAALVALERFSMTRRRGWVVAWFVLVYLAGATLYLAGAVAVVASLARIAIVRRDEMPVLWRRLPLVVLGWTVLYTPWLGVIAMAARAKPPHAPEELNWRWWEHRLQAFGTGREAFEPITLGSWIFWIAVAIGIVASFGAPRLQTAAAWFLGGAVATVIILQLRPHYAHVPRYLLAALLGTFVLAGGGIAMLWRRRVSQILAIATVAVFVWFSAGTLRAYYGGERADWRSVAEFVHDRAAPGDVVILTNNWVVRNFGYYWQRLESKPDVRAERFIAQLRDADGPMWIVTGQCRPNGALAAVPLIGTFARTDIAEVRYVGPGQRISFAEELCPE